MTASAYGISDTRHGVDLLERLSAVGTGAIIGPESPFAKQHEYDTFLESAYRRMLQMDRDDPASWWFRVARRKPAHDETSEYDPEHPHAALARDLVFAGLFAKVENKRAHRYRITQDGIAYVEAHLEKWGEWRGKGRHEALRTFNVLAESLAADGQYILPEPYRGWWYEAAFEDLEKGWRYLYRYRRVGREWAWDPYEPIAGNGYFYATVSGYQITTEQDILADVPF